MSNSEISGVALQPFAAKDFKMAMAACQYAAHENAKAKGFWDKDPCDAQLIALCHSELSEMLEALREPHNELEVYASSEKIPDFSAAEEEAADVVIRLMDMCEARGWNLGPAIIAKMEYNSTRPRMHGGKKF